MNRRAHFHCPARAGFLLAIVVLRGEVCAQSNVDRTRPVAKEDRQEVLVLRDGGVLIGRIERAGDRYLLTRAGGEMQIPSDGVMLIASSLDEAYAQRRRQMVRPTAEAHLVLAEWCLRNDLVAQAKQELADARASDPRHARLALLERRLALAVDQPQKQPLAQSATKPPSRAADRPEPMDASVHDLPNSAVERFTRKVQPVLVNNCTTSGCHQPGGAQQFQLDRAILRGLANRRSTMNNLAATLQLVDREQPQLSPLLTVPRRAHGGLEGPIFGPRQEQAFRRLVDFVALVTENTTSQDETPAAADAGATSAREALSPRLVSPVLRYPRSADELAPAELPNFGGPTQAASDPAAQQRLRFGVRVHKWRPRDPFDPEIFNRRYASNAASADPAETTTPTASR